nr:hemagglutinin repeat-containing protein [Paraburkholderia adhaesiva]
MRHAAFAALAFFGLAPVLADAQIVPSGAHAPNVISTANGLQQVNVTKPSGAGVSMNTYSQFDVQKQGVILNNSPVITNTNLAGQINGNPNFGANDAAKIIVNQVNSNNPSVLKGYVEVAGQKAAVVIANGSGIVVDGGGFINTSRGILTTGNPLFDASGNLTGFNVIAGTITVQGAGLNASNIDQVDLLSRALEVNAAIYANTLNVTTGSNNIDYASLTPTPVAGTGAVPSVAIDVAQLGGMYANRITLVGNENGVGVANAGTIAAQAGDLILTTSGQLVQASTGQMNASGNIDVNAAGGTGNAGSIVAQQAVALASGSGTLASSGTLSAQGGDLTLTTGGQIQQSGQASASGNVTLNGAAGVANSGSTYAQQNTAVTAGGVFSNSGTLAAQQNTAINAGSVASSGTLAAGINPDGTAGTGGNLSITSAGTLSANGYNLAAGAATLYGATLDLSNAQTWAGTALTLAATGGNLNLSAATTGAGTSITASAAGTFINDSGSFNAPQLAIRAANLSNRAGSITQTGTGPVSVAVTGTFDNTGGSLQTNSADLSLTPAVLVNDGGTIANAGTGTLSINTSSLSNQGGEIATNGVLGIQADTVSNQGGQMAAQSSATINAGSLDNSAGGYVGANAVAITGTGAINNASGTIESNTALDVTAQTINDDGGAIRAFGSSPVSVNASGALTNRNGEISSNADLTVHGGSIDNSAGSVAAAKNLTVSSDTTLTNDNATAEAGGNVDVTAGGTLSNQKGHIEALGAASQANVSASSIDNTDGSITNAGTGPLNVTATDTVTNANTSGAAGAGLIAGNGDVGISTPDLVNQGATVSAAGALALNVSAALNNNSGVLASGGALALNGSNASASNVNGSISGADVSLDAASLDNSNGQIANSAGGTGNITIQTGALANGGGMIGSTTDLNLNAASLGGDGQIIGGRDANVSLGGDYTYDAANLITANRNLSFTIPGTLTNNGMLGAAGNATITAANVINAAGATIASGNPGDLSAGATTVNVTYDISNAGAIEGNAVTTNSATLENAGSMIGDTVTANAGTLTNVGAAAIIAGARQVNLWVPGTFTNSNGAMVYSLGDVNIAANGATDADGNLVNQTGTVNNLSSTIQAQGALNIAANVLNNVRENIQTDTTSTSQTYVMRELPWWNTSAPGSSAPFTDANTVISNAYYVNPADIVSITTIVTPDGYALSKVVVNLPANVSAFEWEQSGLSYSEPNGGQQVQYGQQSRLTPSAGQVTLYVTNYTADQSNPDQVAGTSGAWPIASVTTVVNQLGTVTYDSQYGDCTTNCVRLETYLDYTDPNTQIIKGSERRTASPNNPLEIERDATETVTSTTLSASSGAPAVLTSGGAMNLAIGSLLNNDNGTIAAGGNLNVNGQAQADGGSSAVIQNTATQLTTTYSFVNRSGYGPVGSNAQTFVPTTWTTWTNPSITLNTGTAGGTITSNAAVTITGGSISNTAVVGGNVPTGTSAQALGLSSVSFTGNGPGAVRTVDGVRAGTPVLTLPTSGLYSLHPAPGAQYLVETDPRFTSYTQFISSNYMLQQLGLNPQSTEKRLGDGLYEEQLVQNQITQLTGKVYLQGYSDNMSEYTALMNSGVTVAQQFGLEVGVALTDAQMAALTSDIVWMVNQTVTLPDGTTQTVLVPQVYLASSGNATLQANGALIAGDSVALGANSITNSDSTIQGNRNVVMVSNGDITNLGGQISGGTVALAAGHDIVDQSTTRTQVDQFATGTSTHTVVSAPGQITATGGDLTMQAGHDLTVRGAQTSASGNISMAAGHAVNIGTVQTSDTIATATDSQNASQWGNTHNVGSTVSAGGTLAAASGGDITVTGSNLTSGGSMALVGAGNVTIQGATDTSTFNGKGRSGDDWAVDNRMVQTNVGSQLSAGDSATVLAGQSATPGNLSVLGSSIVAGTNGQGNGAVQLGATGDVNLGATYTQAAGDYTSHSESSGFLSHSSTDTARQYAGTNANGSLISGDTVTASAGHDLNIQGSAVVGTNDVNLVATNNVNITTTQNTASESDYYHHSKSGLMASGLSVTIGKQSQADTTQTSTVTNNASVVGASDGNVSITAGQNVGITGSEVIAGQNVALTGQNVTVNSAYDTYNGSQSQQFSQSGLTIGLGGGLVGLGQAMAGTVRQGVQSGDSRLAAVQAVGAAEQAYEDRGALEAAASGLANGDVSTATQGIQLRISIGSSHSSSNSGTSITTAKGSSIIGNGDVSITATGAPDANGNAQAGTGDIAMTGATVLGKNVGLDANNAITLQSAQSTETDSSSNSSTGWNAGVGIGVGKNTGISIFANGSNSHGQGNGSSVTQDNTTIAAGDTLTMKSGGDTTLAGAQVSGNTVKADVSGDLTMTSLQDTSNYGSNQHSSGISGTLTFGSGSNVDASIGHTGIDSNYASVNQQTGIVAGTGGFDVNVAGHTQLNGAEIASAAPAASNSLTTGSLGFSNIRNSMSYSGSSEGFSLSGGPSFAQTSDSASGVTQAAVSPATITVKSDEENGTDSTAGLSRDTANANQTVQNTFNLQQVQNDLAFQQAFSKVATYAAGKVADALVDAYGKDSPFAEGGVARDAMHAAVAAIGAALGGGNIAGAVGGSLAGDMLQSLAAPIIEQYVAKVPAEYQDAMRNALNEVVATAGGAVGGAVAGGGSSGALAGANSAAANEVFNRQLDQSEYNTAKKYAALVAQQLGISVEDAEGRIVAEMQRNVDGATSQAAGGIHDYQVRSVLGCEVLECTASSTDPNYWNHNYNSQYIAANQAEYNLGVSQQKTGQTYNGLVTSNIKNNPVSSAAAGVGMMGLGVVTGGPLASAGMMSIGAIIGGAANGGVQLAGNQPFDWTSFALAGGTGAVSTGMGFVPVLLIGTGSALTGSALQGQNPNGAMAGAAVGTAIGYPIGAKIEGLLNSVLNPWYRQEWQDIGMGISKYVAPSVIPSWMGGFGGGVIQEKAGEAVQNKVNGAQK